MGERKRAQKKKHLEETSIEEKKAARTKAPPSNITRGNRLEEPEKLKEVVISETDGSDREKEGSDSDESEEGEGVKPGIVDIEKYEFQIAPQMRMKNALEEQRDVLERERYIAKVRSAQTIKIICDPGTIGKMYKEQLGETTFVALADLRRWEDMIYGTIIEYVDQYLYSITDVLPQNDEEVWGMFQKRPQEYITAIKIRDASQNIGQDLKKHFLLGNEERTNFAVTDYLRRKY